MSISRIGTSRIKPRQTCQSSGKYTHTRARARARERISIDKFLYSSSSSFYSRLICFFEKKKTHTNQQILPSIANMSALANRPSGGAMGGVISGGNDGSSDNNVLSQYKVLTLTFNQDCT